MTPYGTHMNRCWTGFRSYQLKVFDLMKLVIQSGALLVRYGSSSSAWIQVWVENKVNSFTFMHLADAFIQSDLHCIEGLCFIILNILFYALCKFLYLSKATCTAFNVHILSVHAFPGNRTHVLGCKHQALLFELHLQLCIWKKSYLKWLTLHWRFTFY